jgi:hypothetical protein
MRFGRAVVGSLVVVTAAASSVFACVGEDPNAIIIINDGGNGDRELSDAVVADVSANDVTVDTNTKKGCPDPSTPATLVFTTALEIKPNFGGLPGADQKCAEAAIDGGLAGTFRAWLSSDGTSAAARIVDPDPTRPIRLVGDGGPIVVACAAKLAGGELAHPIDKNQRADNVDPNRQVWTGTFADGGLALDGGCKNWTEASPGIAGVTGNPHEKSSLWTEAFFKDCGGDARLYCFQVP